MTEIRFTFKNGNITGFDIKGHSSADSTDEEGKIICAAVSSAAYMAVNTLSEIIGAEITADIDDAKMSVKILTLIPESQAVLKGLELHLSELSKQYGENIKIIP